MSIRLRLTLWYSAVVGVTVVALCVAVYVLVHYVLFTNEKNDMRALAHQMYSELHIRISWNPFLGTLVVPDLPAMDEFRYSGYFLQVVDYRGNIRQKNINGELPLPPAILEGGKLEQPMYMESRVGQSDLLIFNLPIMPADRGGNTMYLGLLQVATVIDDVEQMLGYLRTVLTLTALAAIAMASSLGWFMARKALQPIEVIINTAENISKAEDLSRRIHNDGPPDEIGRLIGTINNMLERIQAAYGELEDAAQAQRRFVSDASHELRTPLTTIRGNVELVEKMWNRWRDEGVLKEVDQEQYELLLESVRDIASEAKRMSRLINDMLMLARADTGQKMKKERIQLLPLVEEVVRKAAHLPRKAEWVVGDLSPLEGAVIVGDEDAIKQLLFIFIENAFKYTQEGEVELSVLTTEDGANYGFRIRDTGIGIDKEHVPHIFDRFYRADPSRGETSGTGLGLSIARWIIDEHHGSIEVLTRKGEGTSFIIWLPAAGKEAEPHPIT